MIDSVPSGQGNSRRLKSAAANIPATYDQFRSMLISASGILIDLGLNEPGWAQLGTALNKANLLSDATAAKIGGLSSNPTPDEALSRMKDLVGSGGGGGGAMALTQNSNVTVRSGRISNAGAGWQSFSYPEGFEFSDVPVVAATPVGGDYYVTINNVTASGFQYCVYTAGATVSAAVQINWVAVRDDSHEN